MERIICVSKKLSKRKYYIRKAYYTEVNYFEIVNKVKLNNFSRDTQIESIKVYGFQFPKKHFLINLKYCHFSSHICGGLGKKNAPIPSQYKSISNFVVNYARN